MRLLHKTEPNNMTKIITVTCSECKEEFDERKVKLEDIEEDLLGQDVVTFKCPSCRKMASSHRCG